MKRKPIYITTLCLTGVLLTAAPSITSQASGANAGISAALRESLSAQNGAEKIAEALPLSAATDVEDNTVCGYTNLGVANVDNHLNIREGAGEDYELVGKLPKDGGCEILETEGDWYKIQSGKVTGYVKAEYVLTGDAAKARAQEVKSTVATTNTQTVYLRVEPNTDCTIWTAMPEGEDIDVVEVMGDWVKVNLDGDECYVFGELVDLSEQLPKAMTMTEVRYGEGVSDVRVSLVNYACQFIGNRYVWGGTSLTNGVDCSGFTMQVFAKYGIYLPHYSVAQAGYGTPISSSEAQPGDLFFYSKGGTINHVAIYMGNGQVVHASSPKSGIKISNAFYRTPSKVTRLIHD